MNKLIKKIGILLGIFVAAVAIYFVWAQRTTENSDIAVYTSLEEATLPVVYTEMFGKDMNTLYGYIQDMKQTIARESLTVLPEDRQLKIHIAGYGETVTGIRYEIRSLDLNRLVERTSLTDWTVEGSDINAVLPIQNLLTREAEYLLMISLDTPDHGTVNYYTRVLWTENTNIESMVNFAVDFTTRTFDYNQARELVTYLETNATEDNSSLGHVTIRSSFSQLTWGGLKVSMAGPIQITLKDMDGVMGNVQLKYLVSRENANGDTELYEAEDNFTMKWNSKRIYLMDYVRNVNEIFAGKRELFSGKRILLGITNDDQVRVSKSSNGQHLAYLVNKDLWAYDQKEKQAVKVFSFRSGTDDGVRSSYNEHDVKVLSISDNGDMDFLTYGYMNRGLHEGKMGIGLYSYSSADDAIREKFFVPVTASYESLKADLAQLSYLGASGMLYLMVDHAVYGIDLNSNEYMVLADSLQTGAYAVSDWQNRFAWQDGSELYGASIIHLIDLDTGVKQELTAPDDDLMRTLGFVGSDFIYGLAHKGDQWITNGRVKELPMYALEIMGDDSAIENRYEQPGIYIAAVTAEAGRVHLNQMIRVGEGEYTVKQPDTIVCTESVGTDPLQGVGWYASEELRKLYFVQLDTEVGGRGVKISTPKTVVYDTSEVLELKANVVRSDMLFYAYGEGHLIGTSGNFAEALNMAYNKMGVVTDQNGSVLWNRVNRGDSKNIKEPETVAEKLTSHISDFTASKIYEDGITVLDARGCMLNQILYFIDKGCPVAAYLDNGRYVLLHGFDQYNVSVHDPSTGQSTKMGLNDASEYFKSYGNDFICGVLTQ